MPAAKQKRSTIVFGPPEIRCLKRSAAQSIRAQRGKPLLGSDFYSSLNLTVSNRKALTLTAGSLKQFGISFKCGSKEEELSSQMLRIVFICCSSLLC